eukprot:GILJ01001127.1.p1 GENE.GILJ01001127.1~~GILJ01001127.1.p1  ORF type:complete len:463 (-),score=42.69 GILJ01001127.1:234-1556(-)
MSPREEKSALPIYMNDSLPHLHDGKKIVLGMTGLPARGKTYIARKVARHLAWLGFSTRVFNVGNYRREKVGAALDAEFFDPQNPNGVEARRQVAQAALDDLVAWLQNKDGEVAIYDGTNSTRERRQMVCKRVSEEPNMELIWVECSCSDPHVIESNIRQTKLTSPDYLNMDPDLAVADFRRRIANYESEHEPLGEEDQDTPYVRLVNAGQQVVMNKIHGYLPGRIVAYLMNLHPIPRPIYMSRHGESEFNVLNKIGGDIPLSSRGLEFAVKLADYFDDLPEIREAPHLSLWTSTMQRARQTAGQLRLSCAPVYWKALDEINVGICDGLTYEEVKELMPLEHELRAKDKLRYRYPRGESYMDVIQRLEPVIFELERQRHPVIVIGHQAVLRCLYAYFTDQSLIEVPHIEIPLHTVFKLTPKAYSCEESRVMIHVPADDSRA